MNTDPGGDFLIAPDSQSLLLQQGEGTAVIDLERPTSEIIDEDTGLVSAPPPLDFLPDFGLVLDLASDGTAAAMVNFNQDDPERRFTQSLFWVSNQGQEKEILRATGSILDAQFDPTNELLYCLISQLLPGEDYQVQPYLVAANVKTGELKELLKMPAQPNIHMSLAPDGLAIIFDETLTTDTAITDGLRSDDGQTIATARLWLLPLFSTLEERIAKTPVRIEPQTLPFEGIHPQWLP